MTTKEIENGALGQRYVLSEPAGSAPPSGYPLVLILHYGGTVTPFYGRQLLEDLVGPALEPLDALLVAPDCRAGSWSNPDAETDLLALHAHLAEQYSLDARRFLLVGYSMGGTGTWYFAARHPELVTAAVPIAGRPPSRIESFRWSTPLHALNSRADELFDPRLTVEMVETLARRGAPVGVTLVEGVSHYATAGYLAPLEQLRDWLHEVWSAQRP